MTGQIKRLIDTIIRERAQGNPTIEATTKTKLLFKGIHVGEFTATSADDPEILEKIRQAAAEMGIKL